MPRYTRRRKTANKLHRKRFKKKTKASRRKTLRTRNRKNRRTRKRGGMDPSEGASRLPRTQQPKTPTLEELMYQNTFFAPIPGEDYKIVNLDNLQQSMAELNQYLKDKKSIRKGKSTGLQINNMNLSECHKILRAELTDVVCLNIEYTQTLGSIKFKNYRQIGPLEIFKPEDKIIIPFITILNLLELRFDATEPISDERWTPMHQLSLLVKDISEAEFNGESREPKRDLTQVRGQFNDMFKPV